MSRILEGRALLSGIAVGYAHLVHTPDHYIPQYTLRENQLNEEKQRLREAIQRASRDLEQISKYTAEEEAKQIIEVHMFIVNDVDLYEKVVAYIEEQSCNAEWAMQKVVEEYIRLFQKSKNKVFKAREQDIHDSSSRILRHLYVGEEEAIKEEYFDNTVLVANTLFSSQFLSYTKTKIKGLVLSESDETSHLAILAESYNIPLITGIHMESSGIKEGDQLILNSIDNCVIVNPSKEQRVTAQQSYDRLLSDAQTTLRSVVDEPHLSKDRQVLRIATNIFSEKDLRDDLIPIIDGVGLFRTEFLFRNFSSLSNIRFQKDTYSRMLQKIGDKPMTIRTLDVGGDKMVFNFLSQRHDTSPLGVRGIRFSLLYPEQFGIQLLCILEAVAINPSSTVKILFPMVSQYEELMRILDIYYEQVKKAGLEEQSLNVALGLMLEVPSSVYLLERLPKEFSFVSLGTNDLLQFFSAAERGKQRYNYLSNWFSPLFLRFLGDIVYKADQYKIDLSICGEMASNPMSQVLLLGAGLRQFSVKMSKIAQTIATMRMLNVHECRSLFEQAMLCDTSQSVIDLVEDAQLT